MSHEFFQKPKKPEIQESNSPEALSELISASSMTISTLYRSADNLINQSLTGKSQEYVDNFQLIKNKLGETNQAIQQLRDEAAGLTVTQEAVRNKV